MGVPENGAYTSIVAILMWIMRILRWKWRYPRQLQLEVVIQKFHAMSLRGSQANPQVQSHDGSMVLGILMGSMAHHFFRSTEKGSVMGIGSYLPSGDTLLWK